MICNIFEWLDELQRKLSSISESLEDIENPPLQVQAALIELYNIKSLENEGLITLTDVEHTCESKLICDCGLDDIEINLDTHNAVITINANIDNAYCDEHQPGIDFESLSFTVKDVQRVIQGEHLIACNGSIENCTCTMDCLKEIMYADERSLV